MTLILFGYLILISMIFLPCLLSLKCHNDEKFISYFPSDFESVFAKHLTCKVLSFKFYPKAVYF